MSDVWKVIFTGMFEGRKVSIAKYSNGALKATTIQKTTVATEGSSDGTSHIFPVVISEDDTITAEGETAADLEIDLHSRCDFSAEAAAQIVANIKI